MFLNLLLLLFIVASIDAAIITQDINDNNKTKFMMALPYAGSTESTGVVLGVVGIWSGYVQKQMNIIATAYYGTPTKIENTFEEVSAYGGAIAVNNYKPFWSKRTFLSFLGLYSYYPNQSLYINGSNDSPHTPIKTKGYNNWFFLNYNYVLPMGEYLDKTVITYSLDRGLPVGRDDVGGGLPFVTGASTIELSPFYNKWTADKFSNEPQWASNGLRLKLVHDNTDYVRSPSRGYNFNIQYSQDFGVFNSTQSWNAVEASYSQYIELPKASWMRQNTIALNIWSAYSPSWELDTYLDSEHDINANRPPVWEGARLGGMYRMRAYASNRFSDKSAIYYGAEYRFIPDFNPLNKKENTWMPIGIDWFQAVFFVEAGRVAPQYTWESLYTDMKYDVGFSLRALAAKVPVRFEYAYGAEGSTIWFMVKQTF